MNSIPDKLQIITEVLDLSSQHVPEGKYLEAMTAVRDIYNTSVDNENTQRIHIFRGLLEQLDQQQATRTFWNTYSLTNGQFIVVTLSGLIVGEALYRIWKK